MLVYLEVYDPTIPENLPENFQVANVEASLAFYSSDKKIFETKPIRANRLTQNRLGTLPVRLTVPVSDVKPGKYDCQLNVIDGFGHKFAFPRMSIAVLPATAPTTSAPTRIGE